MMVMSYAHFFSPYKTPIIIYYFYNNNSGNHLGLSISQTLSCFLFV